MTMGQMGMFPTLNEFIEDAEDMRLDDDVKSQIRWRQVQYLSELFWKRWRREYLQTLQSRQKWHRVEPNFALNDLVLVCDESSPRGKWPLGRVIQTYPDDLSHVQVLVDTQNRALKRPITKLCKLATTV